MKVAGSTPVARTRLPRKAKSANLLVMSPDGIISLPMTGTIYFAVNWEKLPEVFAAFLTPVVAVTTVYIAIQQYRINRQEYRLALRDRRLKTFEATVELIATVIQTATAKTTDLTQFLAGTIERDFLFGSDVTGYLKTLYDKAVDVHVLSDADGQEQRKRWKATLVWFSGQDEEARKVFGKYLTFK